MAENRPRIPKVIAKPAPHELRRMPLTPVDGFVLSRVDGQASEDDIVLETGLPVDQVRASLDRLASLSLVSLGEAPTRHSAMQARGEPEATRTPGPAAPPPAQSGTRSVATPSIADLDLTDEEQQRINDVHAMLDTSDHYALLGVARDAVRKDIKRAYYERASAYHPDRYFRRKVGTFKGKLEAIFGRVTLAHDVLTDKVQRAEYDTYLADVARVRELEARVELDVHATRSERPPASSPSPSPSSPSPSPAPSRTPPPPSAPSASTNAVVTPTPGEIRRPSRPSAPIDPRARRDLLAKHLIGGRMPPAPSVAPPAQAAPADPDALRRHFDQRKADVARAQGLRHKTAGDLAMTHGDVLAAASSYRSALTFLPDDPELVRLHREAQHASATALAETYRKQGAYEEKSGRWPAAANSWTKLADLVPKDAHAQERAGNAILQAKGSLHDAATYAQRAVTIEPKNAEYRKLLATIYLEAGLMKNARRELDAAEQIAPGDVSIAVLAKRLANATGH